jgi:hypothetical protein
VTPTLDLVEEPPDLVAPFIFGFVMREWLIAF